MPPSCSRKTPRAGNQQAGLLLRNFISRSAQLVFDWKIAAATAMRSQRTGKGRPANTPFGIPWPCRFHGDLSGATRTSVEAGSVSALVESSGRHPQRSSDCETQPRAARMNGVTVEISPTGSGSHHARPFKRILFFLGFSTNCRIRPELSPHLDETAEKPQARRPKEPDNTDNVLLSL